MAWNGISALDGSLNVTVVAGTSLTGIYAADGSINVIVSPGSSYVGAYHPCGAWWVTVAPSSPSVPTPLRAPDGSLYVYTSLGRNSNTLGGQPVTVVSGSLNPSGGGAFLPLFF